MKAIKKLLCIDDDTMLLDILQDYFEQKGYQVFTADNGSKGLSTFRQHRPDLILLDLRMPVIDGFQVLQEITVERPHIPIIVISGEGEMADVIQALHLGAWHYMTKPVENYNLLEHAIQQALEKADLIMENMAYQERLEQKLSSIIQHFPGFVFTCDAELKITYANEVLINHIGHNPKGELCFQSIFGKDSADLCFPRSIDNGDNVLQQEIQSAKDKRWYHMTVLPVTDKYKEIAEYQVVLHDITDQKQRLQNAEQRENQLREENALLLASLKDRFRFGELIGKSQAMQEVYQTIIKAARSEASVVISGESGTGKELVAKSIHENSSRKDASFVCVNCSAIPENLIESEFFGYRKGAFSGATKNKHGFLDIADGGTLFLDEVGDIPHQMQVKLLRAIEGGGFMPLGGTEIKKPDVRIISATNRDLTALVKEKRMRQDFLFRIHVIPIHLPPLRERKEDIRLLIDHFLHQYDPEYATILPAEVRGMLLSHSWPGNVRELQNTIHRYISLKTLDFIDIPDPDGLQKNLHSSINVPEKPASLTMVMEGLEKQVITKAFERNQRHQGKTAEALGIDRKTLYRKMKTYNIIKP
ncbi:MAG: sigma-54-dependent Fis family transcriptional regulator [Desulforhopalus sp.]